MQQTNSSVLLRNRLISVGLELVLSHTKKSCIVSYHGQFSENDKIKITSFVDPGLWPLISISAKRFCSVFTVFNMRRSSKTTELKDGHLTLS